LGSDITGKTLIENKVMRKIFGSRREETFRRWKKVLTEDLHNWILYQSLLK
jgi:hypothetical protein